MARILSRVGISYQIGLVGLIGIIGLIAVGVIYAAGSRELADASRALDRSNAAIRMLAELHVKPDIEAGRLVGVLDQYRSDETRFCAVFPSHRHIRRIATIFVEYVQCKLAAMQEK